MDIWNSQKYNRLFPKQFSVIGCQAEQFSKSVVGRSQWKTLHQNVNNNMFDYFQIKKKYNYHFEFVVSMIKFIKQSEIKSEDNTIRGCH